ncbi:MAG TPA: hypothetical protein VJ063_05920, partial [Verrucomicrobiae bacterium]|nr:hypothetical protein [Verrucomicrobiae bacterium]
RRDSFRIFYDAEHRQGDIHFTWRAEIVGEPSGRIVFTMDGVARKTFLKNRIGFCVLHPIRECAGAVCRVRRADGTLQTANFPKFVTAEQPVAGFSDIVELAHEDVPGRWIELKFSGDLFEAEDQRNWIDASYKTYCTPLRLPFPAEMRAGQRLPQQVALEISGTAIVRAAAESDTIDIEVNTAAATPLPKLGLGVSSLNQPLSAVARDRLSRLNLAHLRADLRLASADWKQEFARAASEANALNLPLEVGLFLPADSSVLWPELRTHLRQPRRGIARFLVFAEGEKSTSARALGLARQHLADFRARIGAGTNADFYQLNQSRPPHTAADFIMWSMNPQVHAFDLVSIAETPEAIRAQLDSAREYFSGKPLVVSPVTLKPRFNPVATGPEPPVPAGELPPQVDPRQMSLFGAAWTLTAYKHLSEGAVESVTFYETAGWRGILETDDGPPVPQKFPSVPRGVFPMYHFFADLAEFAGGESLASVSTRPLAVNALVLRKQSRIALLMANLTDTKQTVKLAGTAGFLTRARILDATTADLAMRDPDAFRERWTKAGPNIELPPFAYCLLSGDEPEP